MQMMPGTHTITNLFYQATTPLSKGSSQKAGREIAAKDW
jgi:hypothetical protein